MLPQGTRRCPRLHLSRCPRLPVPVLPPLALPAAPAVAPPPPPFALPAPPAVPALPEVPETPPDTGGSVAPSRAACGRSRACGAGASRSITSARPAQSPCCPRRCRRLHCCHQSQCRSRRSKSFHRRPWTSSRRVRSRSCHLSRRSQRSQSSHLCRHRLSPSPRIRQQRKARPTAKTGPFSLRPYVARRGLLWSRDSPSDRVAVSNYGECRCGRRSFALVRSLRLTGCSWRRVPRTKRRPSAVRRPRSGEPRRSCIANLEGSSPAAARPRR